MSTLPGKSTNRLKPLKGLVLALAAALAISFVAPLPPPEAFAQQTAKKKKKQAQKPKTPRKKQNFRAARPDEYDRIFACDDFSLAPQPFCVDGGFPRFNVNPR
jgi:hypothetical protein